MSQQATAKHDPRTCQLCATLRHPATAKQGRALPRPAVNG